jgi:hypothetical protein
MTSIWLIGNVLVRLLWQGGPACRGGARGQLGRARGGVYRRGKATAVAATSDGMGEEEYSEGEIAWERMRPRGGAVGVLSLRESGAAA